MIALLNLLEGYLLLEETDLFFVPKDCLAFTFFDLLFFRIREKREVLLRKIIEFIVNVLECFVFFFYSKGTIVRSRRKANSHRKN